MVVHLLFLGQELSAINERILGHMSTFSHAGRGSSSRSNVESTGLFKKTGRPCACLHQVFSSSSTSGTNGSNEVLVLPDPSSESTCLPVSFNIPADSPKDLTQCHALLGAWWSKVHGQEQARGLHEGTSLWFEVPGETLCLVGRLLLT